MKKLVFSFILSVVSVALFASEKAESNSETSAVVSGVIVDADNGEALVGVAVSIEDETVYTDFDGAFTFENLSPGNYEVSTNYISYVAKTIELKAGTEVDNTIALKSN